MYLAKAPRRKAKNIFRIPGTWRLCDFARDMIFSDLFPVSEFQILLASSFPSISVI
jgi:hypothetical protein